MTSVLTRLELGEDTGHPFRGNQYTSGESDGKAGDSVRGRAGQNALRTAMVKGLPWSFERDFSQPGGLMEVSEGMRRAAKEEIVTAAGADITKAAMEDEYNEGVRAEMNERYDFGQGHDLDARSYLEQEFLDNWQGTGSPPDTSTMSNEELYGQLMAQQYVDTWAVSAADSDPTSLGLQQATADVLNAESGSFDVHLADFRGETAYAHERATMQAFVQGEYDRTQAFLKENGITEVTLHRGFVSASSYPEPGAQPIDMNPASSWTVDRDTAVEFSYQENGPENGSGNQFSYVLTMTVPASDIISTARTGQGALHEGEVLVRNQPNAVAYWGSASAEYPGEPPIGYDVNDISDGPGVGGSWD